MCDTCQRHASARRMAAAQPSRRAWPKQNFAPPMQLRDEGARLLGGLTIVSHSPRSRRATGGRRRSPTPRAAGTVPNHG